MDRGAETRAGTRATPPSQNPPELCFSVPQLCFSCQAVLPWHSDLLGCWHSLSRSPVPPWRAGLARVRCRVTPGPHESSRLHPGKGCSGGGISDLSSALLRLHVLTTGVADGLERRKWGKTGHAGPVPADAGMGWVWGGHPSLFSISSLLSTTLELQFVNKMS